MDTIKDIETEASGWQDLLSERLCLRRLRLGDESAIVAYRSLPEVERYQGWQAFQLKDAQKLVANQMSVVPNTPDSWVQLAITARESGALIGDCGIHFLGEETQQVELGITLSPTHQGRGLAAEALKSVLTYVFGRLNKHRVVAIVDAENGTSARLFERFGFRKEAHHIENILFRGTWGSEFVFALLHREWQEMTSQTEEAEKLITSQLLP